MKKFLKNILIIVGLTSILFFAFLKINSQYVDFFYDKFTSPLQSSLILGDSKGFMGIRPDIIDKEVKNFDHPMYNYSFTMGQTAYGDYYLNSVKRKLKKNTKNGLFIISVNAWVLAEREDDNIDKEIFFEADLPPHNMHFQSIDPNIEYVIKNFNNFHFKSFYRKTSRLYKNGWQEVLNLPKDCVSCRKLNLSSINKFTEFSKKWKNSKYRLSKLEETVSFLKQHGTVILLRMPGSFQIEQIEKKFCPNFDSNMSKIADNNKIRYLNFAGTSNKYRLFDGVHFDLESTITFTKALSDSINIINSK